ncbi:MAG: hypothetical protein WC964_04065, partial [Acholeplasmataceae bacterium]
LLDAKQKVGFIVKNKNSNPPSKKMHIESLLTLKTYQKKMLSFLLESQTKKLLALNQIDYLECLH